MNAAKQAFLLLASLALLASSGWYLGSSAPKFRLDADTLMKTTDTVITELHLQQFDTQGNPANSLVSPMMRHIPNNNTHWIKSPQIIIAQPNQPAWEIHSREATALYGGQKITFKHDVRIHQNKSDRIEESTFTTEQITYFPQTKVAITSKDVLFEQPGNRVASKGMKANLLKKHIQLMSQARGVYDPNHG